VLALARPTAHGREGPRRVLQGGQLAQRQAAPGGRVRQPVDGARSGRRPDDHRTAAGVRPRSFALSVGAARNGSSLRERYELEACCGTGRRNKRGCAWRRRRVSWSWPPPRPLMRLSPTSCTLSSPSPSRFGIRISSRGFQDACSQDSAMHFDSSVINHRTKSSRSAKALSRRCCSSSTHSSCRSSTLRCLSSALTKSTASFWRQYSPANTPVAVSMQKLIRDHAQVFEGPTPIQVKKGVTNSVLMRRQFVRTRERDTGTCSSASPSCANS